jgi:hypothetical protein
MVTYDRFPAVNENNDFPPAVKARLLSLLNTKTTEDTGEDFKIIVFSDGTIRAVPVNAFAPATPTGLARTVYVSRVALTWAATSGASQYVVYRNGIQIAVTSVPHYTDWDVIAGGNYSYQIRAKNVYNQQSGLTAAVSASITPDDNIDPEVSVTLWPPVAIPGQKQIVRVCGLDVDGQSLIFSLAATTGGTLEPTNDPSVWLLTTV